MNPNDLMLRDIAYFEEHGLDPAAQGLRHEMYSKLRHEKMRAVRSAREEVVRERRAERRKR